MEFAVTQPFFELQTPDFAWKFVWIVSANFEPKCTFSKKGLKNEKGTKSTKMNLKFGRRYRSSYHFYLEAFLYMDTFARNF